MAWYDSKGKKHDEPYRGPMKGQHVVVPAPPPKKALPPPPPPPQGK